MKIWRVPTTYIINQIAKGENVKHLFGKIWYWVDGKTLIKTDKLLKEVNPTMLERYERSKKNV